MDIYEDDIYFPEDRHPEDADEKITELPDENIDEEPQEEITPIKKREASADGASPGTRIIYQAPESSRKRKFTGFRDDVEEETLTVTEQEPVRHEYKGGYAYEEEMKKRPAVRKQAEKKPQEKALSFEEEKRRRYEESLRKAEEERKARAAAAKKKALFEDSDMEEIDIDGRKKKTTGDKVRIAVMVVAIIAMVIAVAVLVKQFVQQEQGSEWEQEVTGLLIDVNEPETTKKHKDKDKNKETTEPTTERVLTIEEQWAQLRSDYPNISFPETLSLKYAKLYAVNQDFVGYLSIDRYGVSLPVVQSQKDKGDEYYYLRKNFYKQYSVYGCPFVFKDSDMMNLDRNTVIFGHNNNSNLAFAPINKYKTLDGYKAAPVIQFDTIYSTNKWKIVAAFITNSDPKDDNDYFFNYMFTKMQSDAEFMEYINQLKQRSLYDTGIDVLPGDKILTLSTCAHEFEDARFVVVARLIRPGETEDVNTAIAHTNEKPRYPQAYYDKKKKKNPYKDAERWFYSGN